MLISIMLDNQSTRVWIGSQDRDRFYEIVCQGIANRVFLQDPLLEDEQIEELWTIFDHIGASAHRIILEHVLRSLTRVSGDLEHAPIEPSTIISEMISSLPDE